MKQYQDCTALVTGANRGIGRAFVEALLNAGAARVYAAVRDTRTVANLAEQYGERVVPLALDVTDANSVSDAAKQAGDVSLLVNNAGVATFQRLIGAATLEGAQQEMAVNYFGALKVIRAFAPVLKANGGGKIINMSSIAGLVNFPAFGTYSASKAAVHSMIQGTRAELAADGTSVFGVYSGPVDTDMGANIPMEKTSAAEVVNSVLTQAAEGKEDIYPDRQSLELSHGLAANAKGIEQHLAAMVGGGQ